MPAKNPRLTITMQPGLHALLRRLSELTGQSQSALIFELLDGSAPVLNRVIRLIEASNDAKSELRGRLALDMAAAQKRIEIQLGLGLEDMGEGESVRDLLGEAEAIHFHRARGAASGKRSAARVGSPSPQKPPSSNRGVRLLTNSRKTTPGRAKP